MKNDPQSHPIVFWILMLSSVFMYQYFLGNGIPQGENEGDPPIQFVTMSVGVILIATAVRWYWIPKKKELRNLLVLMIFGLAMAEVAQFYQIFLIGDQYPQTQLTIFILSILGVGQFAPIYAKKQEL